MAYTPRPLPSAILKSPTSYKLRMDCLPRARPSPTSFFGQFAAVLLFLAAVALHGQVQTGAAQASSPETVAGRVVNAISGAPIARVLVQLGPASTFTDHDGKFALADVPAGGGGTVELTKPGYFTSPEHTDPPGVQVTATQLATPLDLRLYPEALLTGTVVAQDGAPLSGVQVTARRLATEDLLRRFETVASVETDSHGAFRLAIPAGDYQVATQFVATAPETGLSILPAVAPSGAGGNTMHLSSGEQQQVELRPHTGVPHTVGLAVQGLSEERSPTLTLSTANGATWQMGAESESESDQTNVRLPSGSYHLSIAARGGDTLSFGEARLTVPDHDIAGITVQLAPVAPIPVEVTVDGHASAGAVPSAQELGLQLLPEQGEHAARREDTIRLQTRPGRGPVLQPHPGRFRLVAAPRSSWYIVSASYGGAEVLGQSLTVSAGSGSPPLQLIVSNGMGSLEGQVTAGGSPVSAWIDLLPTFPSATPVISLRSASDGSFSLPSVQPGSYLGLALEHRTGADLADPAVRGSLGVRTQTVTVQPGTKATLDLEILQGSSAP